MLIQKGATDKSVELYIVDSTDGTPETGVVYNSAGIDLWYRREGAAVVQVTEVDLAALTTAHTDGGFKHIRDGVYRFDLPDAAWATGANQVVIGGTITGMQIRPVTVQLVDFNPNDAMRLGLTALPNAVPMANGGLPTVDANGRVKILAAFTKNTAINNFHFIMTDSTTHNPATGKTVTVSRVLDNGTFGGGTLGSVTEIANGMYRLNIPAADLNADVVTFMATASGCDNTQLTFVMTP